MAGAQPAFPPSVVVEIKALACELPARRGLPLARWSLNDLRREVLEVSARYGLPVDPDAFDDSLTVQPDRSPNARRFRRASSRAESRWP